MRGTRKFVSRWPLTDEILGGDPLLQLGSLGIAKRRKSSERKMFRVKKRFCLKRRFYVTVANLAAMRKTESVQIDGQMLKVQFYTTVFVYYTVSYAKRLAHRDDLVWTREIPVPVRPRVVRPYLDFPLFNSLNISRVGILFVLAHGNGRAGQSTQSITLYLTITVLANMPPPIVPNNPPPEEISAKGYGTPAEETTTPSIVPDSGGPIQPSAPEPVLPSPDPLSVKADTPMAHAKASPTEKALTALRRADEVKKPIDRKNTWKGVVSRVQWMMDIVSPIAEALIEQYEGDDNVITLLETMHDAFDFAHHEDALRSIKPDSKQAEILTLVLQDVCNCGDFIQSYAEDPPFWKRTLKNVGGGVVEEIEGFITTEITAFQILDGVGILSRILSAKVDRMSTQLEWMSSQVSDDSPRFVPEKSCLPGTRTAFLDFIVNWVNDPTSKRNLVLFFLDKQARESHRLRMRSHVVSIMHRLTSSYILLRKEQYEGEAYHL
ncbi:hypothetical protein BJY52DRAFT_1420768 [Lactarius psammicola]|nr:hypothetical protein BJY52DRAFT_1420768 [Lactarius psammicola]